MAFENLSEKLQDVFKKLTKKGKLNEKDVKEALREVKLALLEADVNFKVVKDFINNISKKAIGNEILESLTPGQQVIKIVKEEMVTLMGSTESMLTFSSKSPTVYMFVGLQGAGKTTTTGKLAGKLRKQGKHPLLVACDIYRPAAIKQLKVVGKTYDIPVFSIDDKNPVTIAKESIAYAKQNGNDIIIIDTAGRLHINEELMDELKNIKNEVKPQEILLVIDAMTGQDSVNVATSFNEKLGLDGIIITKLDGDTRGGAALSIRSVTNKPIKFIGMGEKMDDLEVFHPDRMVSRILGMGDVLTLIEKAQEVYDKKSVIELEKKMKNLDFDLNDFLSQMQQIKKMGSIKDIMNMLPIPAFNKINTNNINFDEKIISHIEAIINSMTKKERQNPSIINSSRKRRIATGSGRNVQEVNKLLKDFENAKNTMKMMNGMIKSKKGKFNLPFFK